MAGTEVGPLAKIMIRQRARRDVKRDVITRVIFSDEDGEMISLSDITGIDPNTLDSTLHAPFISGEISKYSACKNHIFGRKRGWFWLYNKAYKRRYHRGSLRNRLGRIDAQITNYRMKLQLLADEDRSDLEEYDRRRVQYEHSHELHMVQMCINHASRIRMSYAQKTNDLYVGLMDLLSQKITILDTVEGELVERRGKYYRRIQYYCECVCNRNPSLGPENMREEMIERMGNVELLGELEEAREEARRIIESYRAEFEA